MSDPFVVVHERLVPLAIATRRRLESLSMAREIQAEQRMEREQASAAQPEPLR